ncbi:hypothetical protein LguiA_026931 [Lonicera macranthoides]
MVMLLRKPLCTGIGFYCYFRGFLVIQVLQSLHLIPKCLSLGAISPIQSLVGRIGRSWVIGVISQLEDGHF